MNAKEPTSSTAVVAAVFARLGVQPIERDAILRGGRDRRSATVRRTIAYTMRLTQDPTPTYAEIAAAAGYTDPSAVRHAIRLAADIVHAADNGGEAAIQQVQEMGLDLTGSARMPREPAAGDLHPNPAANNDELAATMAERFLNYDGSGIVPAQWSELDDDEKGVWRHLAQVARRIIAFERALEPAHPPIQVSRTKNKKR